MTISRFEDILGWQKAIDLAEVIYKATAGIRDFSFLDQIRRAVTSISNNIAEGFGRGTDKDFAHFLDISVGSCFEVKSLIYLGERIGYFPKAIQSELLVQTEQTVRLIRGLRNHLRSKKRNNGADKPN